MDKKDIKKVDVTPIEDLITEDFGAVGTPEREQFEMECDAFIIGEQLKDERLREQYHERAVYHGESFTAEKLVVITEDFFSEMVG